MKNVNIRFIIKDIIFLEDDMNYFTNSLLEFLSSTKQNNYIPEINNLKFSNDGTSILSLKMEDRFPTQQTSIPELFNASLCFMILDSYIDSLYYEMEGTKFNEKYKNLPKNNNIEIMFSQLYRILKLYRNATIHHVSGISITKDLLNIEYSHGKINYLFTITHKGIEIIEDMVLCFFYYNKLNYSYHYKEYLFYSYYDDILKEIIAYNDENNDIETINSKKINRFERLNCDSINFKISNIIIIFDIPQKIIDRINCAIDINISINEKHFIIPIEVLDHLKQMSIEEINKFELK